VVGKNDEAGVEVGAKVVDGITTAVSFRMLGACVGDNDDDDDDDDGDIVGCVVEEEEEGNAVFLSAGVRCSTTFDGVSVGCCAGVGC
jgi:hypothetical protein